MNKKVMLAKEYEKGMKGSKKDTSKFAIPPIGWRASEKFDGYRALFYYDEEGTPIFISRAGKKFNAPEWFLKAMPQEKLLKGMTLDGELWAGRENFQMMGTVRKKIPVPEEWVDIQYVVYDITNLDDMGFTERIKTLKKLVIVSNAKWQITKKETEYPFHNVVNALHYTPQKKITSLEMMETYYQEIIGGGGEGIMIKHPNSVYENGRSSNLLKYKPSFDREAIIVDYNGGQGKYTGMLGGFVCRPLINCDTYMKVDGSDDHIFTLSGMDDSVRKNYQTTHPKGTIITYECSGFTDKGIPRFARYLRKRDDVLLKEGDTYNETLLRIIEIFTALEKHCKNKGDVFRAKSYSKVLGGLRKLEKDSELTSEKLDQIPGLGKGIKEKIREITDTGTCNDYTHIQKFAEKETIKDLFLKIHGVGPACAEKLVNCGYNTIEDLRTCEGKQHLNDVQLKGLRYFEDINERIPYKEIQYYEKVMKSLLKKIDPDAELTIAGSYRRKNKDSGDIDLLLKAESNQTYELFIRSLKKSDILVEDLARGDKKYMGIGKSGLSPFGRRVDIMYTTPQEYPFAILYFTGSAEFNIKMRNEMLEKGYTLNEHGVKYTDKRKKMKEVFNTEKDIFDYFGYSYVEPENR